jgi:hypothetical protein
LGNVCAVIMLNLRQLRMNECRRITSPALRDHVQLHGRDPLIRVSNIMTAPRAVGILRANGVSYLLDDSNTTKSPTDIAAEASGYTVLIECLR